MVWRESGEPAVDRDGISVLNKEKLCYRRIRSGLTDDSCGEWWGGWHESCSASPLWNNNWLLNASISGGVNLSDVPDVVGALPTQTRDRIPWCLALIDSGSFVASDYWSFIPVINAAAIIICNLYRTLSATLFCFSLVTYRVFSLKLHPVIYVRSWWGWR